MFTLHIYNLTFMSGGGGDDGGGKADSDLGSRPGFSICNRHTATGATKKQ